MATAWDDLGPTLQSAHGSTKPPKKNTPPAIKRIVAELGLRYRPASGAALEDHRRAIELLADDLADIPPDRLEVASREWVRGNSFMPRAADLVRLVQSQISAPSTSASRDEFKARMAMLGNQNLDEQGRTDIRWIVENGSLRLIDTVELIAREERLRDPANVHDIARLTARG